MLFIQLHLGGYYSHKNSLCKVSKLIIRRENYEQKKILPEYTILSISREEFD